ncbi:hypothetical protein K457DRAFT_121274 [Linnemannia elongata AG-77]|uniref:Uncharacterized protein n=1 Tax=Linnemannia elongata AG-77 TaxID=1314771 RepID=A0A197KD92_9FUNG|nr:hypothetical protein K457DRAFT_121274 [Linnemannia elongata AG-77]
MSASILRCTVCDPFRTFKSAEQERRHRLEYHAESFTVAIAAKSGLLETVVVNQVDGVFKCQICETSLTTKTGCRKHLKNNLCTTGKDNNQDPPELTLPAVTLPKRQDIPPLPEPRQQPETRAFNNTVLYSYGELHASTNKKRKTLGIVESLGIEPISIKDALATRSYVELSDEVCELLNRDWQFSPHLCYAPALILAGCLLVNSKNGQAVIANTVEAYGRQKTVDIHREPFVVQKDHPATASLPPSIKTSYRKVWPVTVPTIVGKRLIIGTKSFDALITSSLRFDKVVEPCIGASTPSLVLTDGSHSLATKIFLDTEHLEIGLKMAESKDTWSISSSDLLYQLRQVKTKFFDVSTFYLCRASSFFADNHPCQPYTIFNLTSFDQAHSGDGVAASNLFHTIACDVIQDGSRAVLKRERVQQLRVRCADQGIISNEFDGILTLFGDDSSLPILGNPVLNKFLENLASQLLPYIAKAIKTVAKLIEKEFVSPAV